MIRMLILFSDVAAVSHQQMNFTVKLMYFKSQSGGIGEKR